MVPNTKKGLKPLKDKHTHTYHTHVYIQTPIFIQIFILNINNEVFSKTKLDYYAFLVKKDGKL